MQNLSQINKIRHFMPQTPLKFYSGSNFHLLMFLSYWNKKNVNFIVYFRIWSMKIHFFTKKHCYMNDGFIWGTDVRIPNFTSMISFFRIETQRKPMISQFSIIIVKFTYSNLIFYVTWTFCKLIPHNKKISPSSNAWK